MKKFYFWMLLAVLSCLSGNALAADVLPEAGKWYLIKSDNVNAQLEDEDYYLYNNNGTLALSVNKGKDNYKWLCEKSGEFFRFKNKAGKYLGLKVLSDNAVDFKINPAEKVNPGCLPLIHKADNKFMLVKNGGQAFDQATKKYDKASSGFSSDYIFEETRENDIYLNIVTEPAGASSRFSWNGESYTGACSFTYPFNEAVSEATLTAQEDPVSPYKFLGFYEDGTELGKTVEISEMTASRTITAKFDFDIYSQSYGEKWIRINWSRDASYMAGLPVSASYENAVPMTIKSDMGSEEQLWCFVGTPESFKIYNKAAGEQLALTTMSSSYGDGTETRMKPAAQAISWHLVNKGGWNISPANTMDWGLNSYGGAGKALKLYSNGDGGNIWTFQKAGNKALTFDIVINGDIKALNTKVGELRLGLGSLSNIISVTTDNTGSQTYYLAENVMLSLNKGATNYRGYVLKGFRVNDGELQPEIKDIPFNGELQKITAEYEVDANDPSQYLFYTPGFQGHPYRIPAITTTKNGHLLAISDFRWCNNDIGFGHVDIVGRISEDNGATWSEQFNIAVGSGISGAKDCGYGDAAVVTDRESGRILIMCCTGNQFYAYGNRENPLRSARLYSDDNGQTWSKPEDITGQMYALLPESQGQFIGAGKICQSRKVKVGEYYRLYAALCTRPGGNYVIYSDDFGQTWAVLGGNQSSCAPGGDEPKCEELPDGSVVLSSRKWNGRYFNIYKYTDTEKATGKWTGVVSSNDIPGGLSFNSNSTNGEIQLVKVMKKSDNTFHYMMIQSVPYGQINSGDSQRSNVCIFYKVFDNYFMDSATDLATGWTRGMLFEHKDGAYSTMCIQPDNKLGFFYEEGPGGYCMVYRPISIEELTGDAYRMYDPATDGDIDEDAKALEEVKALAKEQLDAQAGNHADTPVYGQYPSAAYTQLKQAYDGATKENMHMLRALTDNFKVSMNAPVFTINNKHPQYGVGKSIYDDGRSQLHFKETNLDDAQMWWKFEELKGETMANGTYTVTNMATGNKFWGAENLQVSSTNPAQDGQFILKTNGTGDPVHAQKDFSVVVRWNDYKPNTGSAWDFTYVNSHHNLYADAQNELYEALALADKYELGNTIGTYRDERGTFAQAVEEAASACNFGLYTISPAQISTLAGNLNTAIASLVLNQPEAGKYYRFQGSTGAYLSATAAYQEANKAGRMMMTDTPDQETVFYLTADNRLITPAGVSVFEYFIERENSGIGSLFTFEDAGEGRYYIVTDHNTNGTEGRGSWYATAAGQPVDRWTKTYNQKAECAWTLEEVSGAAQTLQVAMYEEYATVAAPVALTVPAGVTAYTVQVNLEETTASLHALEGTIPAGCPVVLKKNEEETADAFDFAFAPDAPIATDNALTAAFIPTQVPDETNAYILSNGNHRYGFYQLNPSNRKLAGHTAYLVLPAEDSTILVIPIDDETTGIGEVEHAENGKEIYYDLQGRRVAHPAKGIYVTKSGKKVVFH